MAEAIVSIVVGRLTDLLNEETQVLQGVQDEIQELVTELMRMKTFLRDADSRLDEHKIRVLLADVRDLAYDAEDVVETFLIKASRLKTRGGIRNKVKKCVCVLDNHAYHQKFGREINHLKTRMQNVFNCFRDYNLISPLEQGRESSSSDTPPGKLKRFYSYSVVEPDIFVGFHGDVENLVGRLVNGSDDCYPVIFIGGMGGLGKTTLATKIYNHPTTKTHFEGLAWVSISQKWQPQAVLQRILIGLLHDRKDEILAYNFVELTKNLFEIQKVKNCLIVLDDIWSNDAWDSLKSAFPTETCGTKLLLTSRNVDLAAHVNPKCFIHKPQLLNAEQSWELLGLKALPKGDYLDTRYVQKMEKLGREMVRNCAGLPLAIAVLGGILVTKPTLTEWEKVHSDSLSNLQRGKSLGENYQREIFHILAWSYNFLPTQLKLCFLYMGKFREDEEIDAETLYQLLIAEGMVLSSDKCRGETMMEVAESYMGELVHKSMVQVKFEHNKFSHKKFKSFLLHDLMRDLSLSIANEDDFFKVVNRQKVVDFRSPVELTYTRQVVVSFQTGDVKSSSYYALLFNKANERRFRSIFSFRSGYSYAETNRWNAAQFRLLRVLALEGADFHIKSVSGCLSNINLGNVLGVLVYLRYLSLRNTNFNVFPYIPNLELLQTLKLDSTYMFFPRWMPTNILGNLSRLQHLYLRSDFYMGMGGRKLRLQGLSKLETLETDNRSCEVKDFTNLTNLRRLTLRISQSYDDMEEMMKYLQAIASSSTSNSCLQHLSLYITGCNLSSQNGPDILRQLLYDTLSLHVLVISGPIKELVPFFEQQQEIQHHINHVLTSRITTMNLNDSWLEEDPMPVLEKLPMLRSLQLHRASYIGKKMVCSATGFPKLTHLELVDIFTLEKWRVEKGSMPTISHLIIEHCKLLEELPEGLKFLSTLQELHTRDMPSDFCDRILFVNGERGPDFYKVVHVPEFKIFR